MTRQVVVGAAASLAKALGAWLLLYLVAMHVLVIRNWSSSTLAPSSSSISISQETVYLDLETYQQRIAQLQEKVDAYNQMMQRVESERELMQQFKERLQ